MLVQPEIPGDSTQKLSMMVDEFSTRHDCRAVNDDGVAAIAKGTADAVSPKLSFTFKL